jgi:hypothetical protein
MPPVESTAGQRDLEFANCILQGFAATPTRYGQIKFFGAKTFGPCACEGFTFDMTSVHGQAVWSLDSV